MAKRKIIITALALLMVACALIATRIQLDYHQAREGLFLLKGKDGAWLEVTDDLFPEESDRLLWGTPSSRFKQVVSVGACEAANRPCLTFEWNEATGRGFVKNIYPDGRKLLICLGRFLDSAGRMTSGLFLGGNLPPGDPDYVVFNRNETGMAYYDGQRYFHIWCNVNEGILDAANTPIYPAQWQFVSSKVLENSAFDLTLFSSHQAMVNGVPVRIERFLYYQTGDTFITLVTRFTNVGNSPTQFTYVYGDEPWLGNYGTSRGNVGWLKDRIVSTESWIDTRRDTFAGMFDYGNMLAGESHTYTGKANFLEWQPASRPDQAYFSNQFGRVAPPEKQVPLYSPDSRVISLEWGPRVLPPGQSFSFTLAVGMAETNAQTGFPVKPDTHLY